MSNIDTKSRTDKQDSELHLGVVSGTLGGRGPITPGFGPKRTKVSVRRSKTQILTDEQASLADNTAWWGEYRKGGPKAPRPLTKPYLPTTRSKSAPGHPSPSKQTKAPAPRRTPAKKGKKNARLSRRRRGHPVVRDIKVQKAEFHLQLLFNHHQRQHQPLTTFLFP